MHLSRCCHGNRDLRCGVIGEKLVQRLETLVKEHEWQGNVHVFRCSHIGGHKVMIACMSFDESACKPWSFV